MNDALYFVGTTNPARNGLALLTGVSVLAKEVAARTRLLLDTTGYVTGFGARLKQCKIEAIDADLVVALQREDELEPFLRRCPHRKVIRLSPAPQARTRSQSERQKARLAAFARHFENAASIELDHKPVTLTGERTEPGTLCGLYDRKGVCLGLAILEESGNDGCRLFTGVSANRIKLIQPGQMSLSRSELTAA